MINLHVSSGAELHLVAPPTPILGFAERDLTGVAAMVLACAES
jgi:hypothetical protein